MGLEGIYAMPELTPRAGLHATVVKVSMPPAYSRYFRFLEDCWRCDLMKEIFRPWKER